MAQDQRQKRVRPYSGLMPREAILVDGGDLPEHSSSRELIFVLAACVLIIGAGLGAYSNSYWGPSIFDDDDAIQNNHSIESLWSANAFKPPLGTSLTGRPVVNYTMAMSYALAKALYKNDPKYVGKEGDPTVDAGHDIRAYHVMNVGFHIIAALLLFAFVRKTLLLERFGGRFKASASVLAGAVALIWVVHPLHTGAVTYTIQRAETVTSIFYLLTMLMVAYGLSARQYGPIWYGAAIVFCAIGMASKEMMASAPLVVIAYDLAMTPDRIGDKLRKRWPLHLGLIATWIVLALILKGYIGSEVPEGVTDAAPRGATVGWNMGIDYTDYNSLSYARSELSVIAQYLQLAFVPIDQCLDYKWKIVPAGDVWHWVPHMIVILALLGATIYGLLRGNAWSFLGAWFFGLLSVTSSFYPIADLAFEHRMYLALAAVISLVVIGGYVLATWLLKKTEGGSLVWLAPALTFVVCVTCVLGYLTYKRNIVYQDTVTIWEDVLRVRPFNARAHSNYGAYLVGRSQDAAAQAERLQREDKKEEADAARLRSDELIQSARKHLETACALDLNYADANNNLGVAMYRMKDPKGAKQHYMRALEIKNDLYPEAHSNLADVLCAEGNWAEARKQYELAVANKPHYYEARKRLVSLLATCPDANVRDGHMAWKHAAYLVQMTNMNDPWALDLLAASYAESGNFEKAKEVITDVLNRLVPRLPEPERTETRRALLMHYRYFENNQPLR